MGTFWNRTNVCSYKGPLWIVVVVVVVVSLFQITLTCYTNSYIHYYITISRIFGATWAMPSRLSACFHRFNNNMYKIALRFIWFEECNRWPLLHNVGDPFWGEGTSEPGLVSAGQYLSVTLFSLKIHSIVGCLLQDIECSLYVDDFLICYRKNTCQQLKEN